MRQSCALCRASVLRRKPIPKAPAAVRHAQAGRGDSQLRAAQQVLQIAQMRSPTDSPVLA
jgi:hypothetical protein